MAPSTVSTKAPARPRRHTRRSSFVAADETGDLGHTDATVEQALSLPRPPGASTRNSTLLFRALLLIAALVALSFTTAALLAGADSADIGPTTPDAQPPAVLVQPDR